MTLMNDLEWRSDVYPLHLSLLFCFKFPFEFEPFLKEHSLLHLLCTMRFKLLSTPYQLSSSGN